MELNVASTFDGSLDWSKAQISDKNPIGLWGVDFVEYAGPDAHYFETLFKKMGFVEAGKIKDRDIKLFKQGGINFIINGEADSFGGAFAKAHGPSVCATGFRVANASHAFEEAVRRGAKAYDGNALSRGATPYLAIYGIGDSLIYFIDQNNYEDLYKNRFHLDISANFNQGPGLKLIDHFTNNVPKGEMQKWCDFYTKVLNFHEARYFDIKGKSTGLVSKVMRSPCLQFSVPINEPTDNKSQIQEYLDEYKGSGIQHIAMITEQIIPTLEKLKANQIEFLAPPPDTYYSMLKERLPQVNEDLNVLKKNAILVDGDVHGYLLQIFSKNVIGPIFYEVIQRKHHDGFGEGNFQALFDSIEADQRARGYIS